MEVGSFRLDRDPTRKESHRLVHSSVLIGQRSQSS